MTSGPPPVERPQAEPQAEPQGRPVVSKFGDVVSQLLRLAGGYVALHEIATQDTLRPTAIALAALLLTGANGVEAFFRNLFGRQ